MNIAIVVYAFPSLSQTFILNQITGLIDAGHRIDIFAERNLGYEKQHADVVAYQLMERVRYLSMPPALAQRVNTLLQSATSRSKQLSPGALASAFHPRVGLKNMLSLRSSFTRLSLSNDTPSYDIIHCHFGPMGRQGVLLRKLGVAGKLVLSFHGIDATVGPQANNDRYRAVLPHIDYCTANTSHTRTKMIQLGCDANRIAIIPESLRLEQFPFRPRHLSPGEPVRLLSVARLVEKKGLAYAIQAVALLLQRYPHIDYTIIGDGPLRPQLAALISALGVERQIHLVGWCSQDEVRQHYEQAQLFVLPSVTARDGDEEGQGLVLQEAQAMGLPVVSTYHNGIPEGVLEHVSGLLVPERDVPALAHALEHLLAAPDQWATMGQAGRAFVEQHYATAVVTRQWLDVYDLLRAP